MSDSIRQQAVAGVVTALQAMTKANGYNFDWHDIQKVRNRNEQVNLPVAVVSYTSEGKDDEFSNAIVCNLQVEIAAVVEWPESDPELALEDLIDDHVTDIERAMLAQNDVDPVLGVTGVERVRPQGHAVGANEAGDLVAIINYVVQYRHNRADPRSYG